jgi:hypothetical protein
VAFSRVSSGNRTNDNYLLFLPLFLPAMTFEGVWADIWLCNGKADDGSRTRDLELGKLALYQLSYVRVKIFPF